MAGGAGHDRRAADGQENETRMLTRVGRYHHLPVISPSTSATSDAPTSASTARRPRTRPDAVCQPGRPPLPPGHRERQGEGPRQLHGRPVAHDEDHEHHRTTSSGRPRPRCRTRPLTRRTSQRPARWDRSHGSLDRWLGPPALEDVDTSGIHERVSHGPAQTAMRPRR